MQTPVSDGCMWLTSYQSRFLTEGTWLFYAIVLILNKDLSHCTFFLIIDDGILESYGFLNGFLVKRNASELSS